MFHNTPDSERDFKKLLNVVVKCCEEKVRSLEDSCMLGLLVWGGTLRVLSVYIFLADGHSSAGDLRPKSGLNMLPRHSQ